MTTTSEAIGPDPDFPEHLPSTGTENPRKILEVSCSTCIGACCLAGYILPLSQEERDALAGSGTELQQVPDNKGSRRLLRVLGVGRENYELRTDCGFLSKPDQDGVRKCGAYGTPSRPKVCGQLPVGSYACRSTRVREGVDEPVMLELWAARET